MQVAAPALARNGNPGIVPPHLATPLPEPAAPVAPATPAPAPAAPPADAVSDTQVHNAFWVPADFAPRGRTRQRVDPGAQAAAVDAVRATQSFFTSLGIGPRQGNDPRMKLAFEPRFPSAGYDPHRDRMIIGTDRRSGLSFGNSADVIAHEYAHRVVEATLGLGNQGQQGTMNESLADTFASAMDDDWLIGEDVTPGGIRDMLHPERHGDPGHMSQFVRTSRDQGGVHINNGIPNKAAALIGEQLGRRAMAEIYADAMVNYMDSRTGIVGAAKATIASAADRYGTKSEQVLAVAQAWDAVGVLDYIRAGR